MKRAGSPFGIVSLVLVLAGVGLFLAWQYGGFGRDDTVQTDEAEGVDVTAPPRDVASNPRAARRYVEASVCNSGCVATDRNCRGTSFDDDAQARCAEQLEACRRACGVARPR